MVDLGGRERKIAAAEGKAATGWGEDSITGVPKAASRLPETPR